jgi:hypothetical protein
MRTWPTAFLALLSLLLMAQRHIHAEPLPLEFGWIIYSKPSVDPKYGKIQGQARQIKSILLTGDAEKGSVTLRDEGNDSVTVEFSSKDSARSFMTQLKRGSSYDVSACRQAGPREVTKESAPGGCVDRTYAAVFACSESARPVTVQHWNPKYHIELKGDDAAKLSAEEREALKRYEKRYEEANPSELALYVTKRECPGDKR